nr:MAG TPA: hypothetical protein [Caudoviricetes sp.]
MLTASCFGSYTYICPYIWLSLFTINDFTYLGSVSFAYSDSGFFLRTLSSL